MIIAMKLTASILVIMFHLSLGEKPLSVCSKSMPFKKINSECTNYKDVCTKQDDPDCNLFLQACEQCPVSKENVASNNESMKTWFFLIITILEIVLIFCLLVEIKWKFCKKKTRNSTPVKAKIEELEEKISELKEELESKTSALKSKETRFKKDGNNQKTEIANLKSQQGIKLSSIYQSKEKIINKDLSALDIEEGTDSRFDRVEDKVKHVESSLSVLSEKKIQHNPTTIHLLNIKLPDIKDPITVNVGVLDNAVKVKRQIASQYPDLFDYKRNKLKCNRTILDDNAYLLPLVGFSQATLTCELDKNTSAKDLVILKLHGNRPLPELIQINKKYSTKEVKQIICKLFNVENCVLYKDLVELPDNSTIDKCKLQDNDTIRLVASEKVSITVKDIFDGSRSQYIEVTNTSKVATFIEPLAKKINSDLTNIILLTDGKYLDPDKFIFKTKLGTGSMITYFCIKKFTGIQIKGDSVATGNGSELFMAINKNKEVILKRFDISRVPNLMKYSPLINELKRLQLFQSHPRFVRVHGVYKDDKYLYVEMEKLDRGSMLKYVNENKQIPENLIAKWSRQILEALKFIHDNGFILGDIEPSNILLDLDQNVKISGFDLARYGAAFGGSETNGSRSRRFIAPEVLSNLPYNTSADVWSLGVILVFLITGQLPNHNQPENDAVFTICATRTVQYDISNNHMLTDLKALIKKCLKSEPSARPSVDKLLQDKCFNQKDA